MAASDVKKIYQDIIADVCKAIKEPLSDEGFDEHTLQELRTLWLGRLEKSPALEPLPVSIVTQVTTRDFRHSNTGDSNRSLATNTKPSTAIRPNHLHQASNVAVSNFNTGYAPSAGAFNAMNPGASQIFRANRPANPVKTSNQVDGANDEVIPTTDKKKSKMITISFQLDGTGPPADDDDDDDEEESDVEANDVGDDLDDDDDDDEGNANGKEDSNPLCSEDDESDGDPNELFEADNVVVCQYDKISRTKNKWRFILKSGVMNIEGRDYVFSKATGDADW